MKVLYAIQATGNGHISRAREVLPILRQMADVDILLSGSNSNLNLPFPVKYRSKGLSLQYNNSGGLSYWEMMKKTNFIRLAKEIRDFPVKDYDLIINDFESISAWAAWYRQVPCISFSHQVSLLSDLCPKPNSWSPFSKLVMSQYAPASYAVGLHFKNYDDYIFTPIIRKEIRSLETCNKGHYTVYLPAVSDKQLMDVLHEIPEVRWEIFSRQIKYPYFDKNITIRPVQHDSFTQSLASCNGLLTGAGFESPAEALYLRKKLFVIPIKGQYEQQCNAEALKSLGIPTAKEFNASILPALKRWMNSSFLPKVHYPDITERLVEQILFDQDPFLVPMFAAG